MKGINSANLKAKATSIHAWELQRTPSSFSPEGVYSNEDTEPVPRDQCTWTTTTFAAYWFSDLVNAGSWSAVSSFVALGLRWWEALLAVFLGGVLLSGVIALNGIVGARMHTPFAVTSRAVFGYNFSKFAVVSRMVIAGFWMSINTYQGGYGIKMMLIAVWPSFRSLPNHLPASAGTTSADMLCFFLFWLIQFPFCLIHPRKLRILFLAKGITLPLVAFGTMIWSIVEAGDQASAVLRAPSTLRVGSLAHWAAFFTGVTASMGTWSTLACNIGDFSRYSKKETSAWLQMLFVPALWGTTALFGAISSNMTQAIYGEILYQPFDVIDKWQGSKGGRAAAFFCAAAWALGNMGTNITANSISAANDMAALFPRWANILRGQIVVCFIGVWAFAPWKVLASAGSFISFMGAYSIVLAPIAGILATDFFFVKKQKYDVVQLYNPQGIYRYTYGCNWRAIVALVCAIGPNMPGMINALNSSINIGNMRYLYCISNIFGILVGGGIHYTLSRFFPDHASQIDECILAFDVLEGRVAKYEKFSHSIGERSGSEEKLDGESKVVEA